MRSSPEMIGGPPAVSDNAGYPNTQAANRPLPLNILAWFGKVTLANLKLPT